MAFRTILIENRAKLEYSLNTLICRKGDTQVKILLDEIHTIIIDSTQVSFTAALIVACIAKKIKIIFTDDSHNPTGELIGYNNNFYGYRKIKEQLAFSNEAKDYLWKKIIFEKIKNQANNLNNQIKKNQLLGYSDEIELGDKTNREGHAAKVYFNSLFGNDFSRDKHCDINKFLNYGYAIILSTINKEIKALGYLTELGIHHIGDSNQFNLSYDFIEPLRPLIDYYVINKIVNNDNFKYEFANILNRVVKYNGKDFILVNAIHLYVEDLLNFLKTGDEEKIRFISYEL